MDQTLQHSKTYRQVLAMTKTLKTNWTFFACLTMMFFAGSTAPPLAILFTVIGFLILFHSPMDRI
jgi:hypothetical protein